MSLIETYTDTICADSCQLANAGAIEEPLQPEDVRAYLDRVITFRTKTGAPRFLRKARKGDDIGAALLERLAWHHGGGAGTLYGPMFSIARVGHEVFDQLDTVASLIAFRNGRLERSHSARWARALGR